MPVAGVESSVRIAWGSKARGAGWLIEADWLEADLTTPLPVNICTWPQTEEIGGKLYRGVGNLVQVSIMNESENPTTEKLTISVSIVDVTMKAMAMGTVERYRNRRIRLYLQTYGDTFRPVGSPVLRWSGRMDRIKIPRQKEGNDRAGAPSNGRIEIECSRAGSARSRNSDGYRLTASQQKLNFPGDLGLDYMHELIENPTLWLSKKFQEV